MDIIFILKGKKEGQQVEGPRERDTKNSRTFPKFFPGVNS